MTHLGVPVDHIANLVTMQLPKDNTAYPFYFDRQPTALFTIPPGFSFVVTDILVDAEVTSFSATQFFLVVVTVDGGRSIEIRCNGHGAHLRLAGGLVIPDPGTPSPGNKGLTARNTTFSTGPAQAQVLGYFVKASTGLGVGPPCGS